MGGRARVLFFAIDAGDPELVRAWADAGELPTLAGLLARAATATVEPPPGVFVSANWVSIFTGLEPDRHGYLCWDEVEPGTYAHHETDPNPGSVGGTPLWERLSEAGRRTAVLDVPHSWPSDVDGTMLVEWGCHDRHQGPRSHPEALIDELDRAVGRHVVGTWDHPVRNQFAPCDYLHRTGAHRTADEEAALFADLRTAVEQKRQASLTLLDRGGWDLFMTVFGESHCAGHQLWHVHDEGHPRHDAATRRALGVDPVLDIYRRIDAALADHLERLDPDDTAYVLLPHGMVAHNDGTDILDPLLCQLETFLDDPDAFGSATRLAASLLEPLPSAVRRHTGRLIAPLVARRLAAAPTDGVAVTPTLAERRWFAVPNNSVTGAVRLNLAGREPEGRIRPEAKQEVLRWLADRLREVINVDTGRPIVREVVITDQVYGRHQRDAFGDLYIEWERAHPIERVWSPATGTVVRPVTHWRTGDHVREGLVVAVGGGIEPGAVGGTVRSVDLAPTLAAALGVTLPDVDGRPISSLLPAEAGTVNGRTSVRRLGREGLATSLEALDRRERRSRRAGATARAWERQARAGDDLLARELDGLGAAHHATRELVERLTDRVAALELEATIARTSAWIRHQPVEPGPLVSVVIPTRDRRELLARAVASVVAQSYPRWEALIIDDGSTDDTGKWLDELDDPRLRVLSTEGVGACAARNIGLDTAHGDLVVYLDDDNRFDPDWFKAVVWTFERDPGTRVAYGARLVDDDGRHHGGADSGEVSLQLLPWDRTAVLDFNRVDMNVLAHRACDTRFDPAVHCFGDWDLVLTLTADCEPVQIPAVAAYYTTDAPSRLSTHTPAELFDADLRHVRAKHRQA